MRESGRKRTQERERKRREGTRYGEAIEAVAAAGRRRSVTSAFAEYATEMLATLTARATELLSVARSAARWQQKRCLSRFIGRLCDRLFDRTSTRPNKNATASDAATRVEQRRRLMELRQRRQQMPTVVFFGDATYGPTMRGHPSGTVPSRLDVFAGRIQNFENVSLWTRRAEDNSWPPPCSQKRRCDLLPSQSAWRQVLRPRRTGVAEHGVVRVVRTLRTSSPGAPLQDEMRALQ